MMTPEQIQSKIEQIIAFDLKHENYDRSVEHAEWCKAMMTGDGQDGIYLRFREKADDTQKNQIKELYISLTPYVLNPIKAFFEKVKRTDGKTFEVNTDDDDSKGRIEQKTNNFYQGETLEEYIEDRTLEYDFYDPNAFIITEFQDKRDAEAVVDRTPYPFEVPSHQVRNYEYSKTGELNWLLVEQRYKNRILNESTMQVEESFDEFSNFYFYAPGFVFNYKEVGKVTKSEKIVYSTIGTVNGVRHFEVYVYENGTTTTPARKVGTYKNSAHSPVFRVSPYYIAKKSLNRLISRTMYLDITENKHVFPQKYVYTKPCTYQSDEGTCVEGYINGDHNHSCPACNGTGKEMHFTEQDVITLELPESKEGLLPLADLAHYVKLPIEVAKWLDEQVQKAQQQVLYLMLSSNAVKQDQLFQPKTATENIIDIENLYDKLAPYTRNVSQQIIFHSNTIAKYLDIKATFEHSYPKELGIETTNEIISQYDAAKTAGMGYQFLNILNKKALKRQYRSAPEKILMLEARQRFIPFQSHSDEMISMILAGRLPDDYDRVLYENQDSIFKKIEVEHPAFYVYEYNKQEKIVKEYVAAKTAELTQMSDGMTVPDLSTAENALNGIQVRSMIQVVQDVAAGNLPRSSGISILKVSFGLDDIQANELMGDAGQGFKLATPPQNGTNGQVAEVQ